LSADKTTSQGREIFLAVARKVFRTTKQKNIIIGDAFWIAKNIPNMVPLNKQKISMTKYQKGDCRYYTKGNAPRFLILSGTHGDEFGVIGAVEKTLQDFEPKLPNFLFIPKVSPSAVRARTRKNGEGFDLNRDFTDSSKCSETRCVIEILQGHQFDLTISFHEDYEFQEFYLYDSADREDSPEITRIKSALCEQRVSLYTGCDDAEDPCLGNYISDGYFSLSRKAIATYQGTFSSWALANKVTKRIVIPEVPMSASAEVKLNIVRAIFDTFSHFTGLQIG